MNYKLIISIFLFSGLILLSSCRDDLVEETTTTVTTTIEPGAKHESDLSGIILTQEGSVIADADIVLMQGDNNSISTSSDENGYFLFEGVEISQEGTYLTIDKSGYFKGYKFVTANVAGKRQHIKIRMADAARDAQFDSSQGGEVTLNTGAKLTIPSGAVVNDATGADYNGNVEVAMHYFDPADGVMMDMMPGDLRAINESDELVQLATFGMIGVELFSSNGQKLNIKDGFDATLEFPLSQELLATAPESIPLWHFEESTGYWRQEGSASIINGKYVGKVKHFSFWNCDAPFPLINVCGQILDQDGNPLVFTGVCVSVVDSWNAASGYTNEDGVFCGKMPRDEKLIINIKDNCGNIIETQQVGPFTDDVDLGPLTVTATEMFYELTGTLVDCNNMPVTEGYVIVTANWQTFVVEADENGVFESVITDCQAGNIQLYAVDNTAMIASQISTLSATNGTYDAGVIEICDNTSNLDEYIRWTVGTGPLNIDESPNANLQNGNLIFGQDSFSNSAYFNMTIANAGVGTYNPEFVTSWSILDNGNFANLLCSAASGLDCSGLNVTITTPVDVVGDYIVGTIQGILYFQNEPYDVSGDFRVILDDITTTARVEGNAWLDSDEDGIQDPNEGAMVNALIIAELNGDFVAETLSDQNGVWAFEDLQDGADYRFYFEDFQGTGFEITLLDAGGDDSVDNDFDPSTGFTDFYTLSAGTSNYNIGLGLITVAQPLQCDVIIEGCGISSTVFIEAYGGVAPYTYELDGVVYQNGIIDGLLPGSYIVTVADATGETCVRDVFIELSLIQINGLVFDDVDGDNFLDSLVIDQPLENVTVELLDVDFNVITSTLSDIGGYFNLESDASVFQYFVRATAPSGYVFITPMQGGSDVSVDGLSNPLDVFDCFSSYYIQIGLSD